MKKRMWIFAGVCAAAVMLAGCEKKISNEYVTLGAYKGIEVEQLPDRDVTDEDVEDQIEYEMDEQGQETAVTDRPAQMGDTVNIDYEGKLDGVAFDGGTAQGADLELGSNMFIAGFEDGVAGHSIGETFDLNLTFPEDYGNTELAGKDVVFTVTLNSITEKTPMDLTEEYIQSQTDGKASNLEEYRAYLKEDMQKTYNDYLAANLRENAWTAVMKNVEVTDYPEDRMKELEDTLRTTYEQMAASYNMDLEEYVSTYLNMELADFESRMESEIKDEIKEELVVDLIIEKEKVDVSEEAMQAAYEKLSKQWGFESKEEMLAAAAEGEPTSYVEDQARLHLVKQWLADHCKPVIED